MSFAQFLRMLAARRMIVLATFLACLVTAIATAFILPARYEARARLILDVLKPDPVTGQVMTNNFLRAYTVAQMEMIKGSAVTGRVVDQLGWANDPAMLSRYERENTDPGADVRLWLARELGDNIEANILEGSNILEIGYTGPSPEAAKQMAGMIRQAYRQEALEEKRGASRESADWYRQQAAQAKKALELAEADRTAFAKANNLVLPPENMPDVETAKLQSLGQQSVAAAAAPALVPQINPMQAQLASITEQLAQAATTLGPNHPTYQALLRQKQLYESLAARQGRAGSNAGVVEGEYQRQRARVIADRGKVDQLQRMQNDVVLKRDQYLKAAQRAADLQLEANTTNAGITDMGPTTGSTTPSFPNRPLIIGMAAATGLGLGILLALLVELMNRRVRSDDDLEVAAHAPVLAVVATPRHAPFVSRIVDLVEGRARHPEPGVSTRPDLAEAAQ
ncbi:MAG: GumC family protein [Chakrabartia sp.]